MSVIVVQVGVFYHQDQLLLAAVLLAVMRGVRFNKGNLLKVDI